MNDLTAPLSQGQTTLLTTMAHQYLLEGEWPIWYYTVETLDGYNLDAEELIRSLPRVGSSGHTGVSYGLTSSLGFHLADDDRPALTIAAGLHIPELQSRMTEPFLKVLRVLIAMQRSAPVSTREVTRSRVTLADIEQESRGLPEGFLARLPEIMKYEPATWGGSSGTTEAGAWWRELRREIRQYQEATTLQKYVETTALLVTAQAQTGMSQATAPWVSAPAPAPTTAMVTSPYIDETLIADLEAKDTTFRTDKLLALVHELNANHAAEHPYACQMLLRALLDHVPPAFGQKGFQAVVANVQMGVTDKAYIKKLGEFRNSGDDVLHRQIGTRPSRITMADLPPRANVNALLQLVLEHLPAAEQPQKA
ncbi:hypothetical protein [Streptomyces cinereoruber]|uniref:hypothetical protein n=1 Tax=Streptomyces cinereoruber TaxID=67260 RepID=UPI00364CEB67